VVIVPLIEIVIVPVVVVVVPAPVIVMVSMGVPESLRCVHHRESTVTAAGAVVVVGMAMPAGAAGEESLVDGWRQLDRDRAGVVEQDSRHRWAGRRESRAGRRESRSRCIYK
jgi:hypothetical protein